MTALTKPLADALGIEQPAGAIDWSEHPTSGTNDVWLSLACLWSRVRVTAPEPTECPNCGQPFTTTG